MSLDLYKSANDKTVDVRDWLHTLKETRETRALIARHVGFFYVKRRAVEYGVKATVTVSMAVALFWGGAPLLIIGAASLILNLSSLILNLFNPNRNLDDSIISGQGKNELVGVDTNKLEIYKQAWCKDYRQFLFVQNDVELRFIQRKVALALVVGFVIFSIFNIGLTAPIILTSLYLGVSLIYQAKEAAIPFVEEESTLNTLC